MGKTEALEYNSRGSFYKIEQLAQSATGTIHISGISDSRSAAIAGHIAKIRGGQVLVIVPSYGRAKKLTDDLSFFVDEKIILVPDEDLSFFTYDAKSHHILEDRLKAIIPLAKGEDCIIVAPVKSAIKKTVPKDLFIAHHISLKTGESAELESLKRKLIYMGYERTESVEAKGQFSLRGGILDVYPPDQDNPYRIEFFDIEVDSIRYFDPDSQRSLGSVEHAIIFPAQEIIRTEYLFEQAATNIRSKYAAFSKKLTREKKDRLAERLNRVLECIETGTNIQLLERYIHYFYESPQFLWDYVDPRGTLIIDDPDRIIESLALAEKEYHEDFKILLERGEVIGEDINSIPGTDDYYRLLNNNRQVFLFTPFQKQIRGLNRLDANLTVISKQATVFNGRMDFLKSELLRYAGLNYRIIIVCSTLNRSENIKEFVNRCKLEAQVQVVQGTLSEGMEFIEDKLLILCDKDIFVTAKKKRHIKEGGKGRKSIKSFSPIKKGDHVVHENHGIGKFLGVVPLEVQGVRKDYLKIKYAGEDLLYVPVEQMDLIQKYIGVEGRTPKVNKLSGGEWKKTKAKAKAAIHDMARELIALSAARQMVKGHAFPEDDYWQKEFEDLFPYEETSDQLRSIEEIKRDMEKPVPMDRLLCGDVGYGKTEVAARAVFKCVEDGKQAAVLVPTTLLANQHFFTFKERFEPFPFNIEMLSRFRSEKQQEIILEKVKRGEIDILIGTHRLLSKDVSFNNLGLLVVDEEQRFGVQHKEAIKQLKKNVDVLTLTATPIPRTLHMSLTGIRNMSIIEEPPEERYPVQTYVLEQNDDIIKEAIERELDRDGQVYVVYNRVRGIHKIAAMIRELVPQSSVVAAHGQMNEKQLEDIMLDFVDKKYDIMVCTTIIESGLDIPNVNTIIIMDADRYGLSQLYQLRGRVGRSNRLAYAYLMYQKNKVLTEQAEKRLQAIREFTEFGAGFQLAMRDLEIRGAGNLLGSEQSGHMMMIGYELYCKLVDDALREIAGTTEDKISELESSVEIPTEAYIPSDYIQDELIRLQMYKKIAAIKNEEDKQEVIDELLDRFGDIPVTTLNLIEIALIKALAEKNGILRVHQEQKKLIFSFESMNRFKPEHLSKVVEEYGMNMLVHGGAHPFIRLNIQSNNKFAEAKAFLTKLSR